LLKQHKQTHKESENLGFYLGHREMNEPKADNIYTSKSNIQKLFCVSVFLAAKQRK
jgi:hypothetical protein